MFGGVMSIALYFVPLFPEPHQDSKLGGQCRIIPLLVGRSLPDSAGLLDLVLRGYHT